MGAQTDSDFKNLEGAKKMAERESAAAIIIFTSKLAIAVDFRLETIVLSQSFSICNTSKKRQFSVRYLPKTVLNGTLFFELPISLSEPAITIPSAPLDCKWNFICYSPLFRCLESRLLFCWFMGRLYHYIDYRFGEHLSPYKPHNSGWKWPPELIYFKYKWTLSAPGLVETGSW